VTRYRIGMLHISLSFILQYTQMIETRAKQAYQDTSFDRVKNKTTLHPTCELQKQTLQT